tara:strand:- start:77831 stop:81703 length:3873 start_codon:yes stop_codon:yes gene_type:complete
MHKQRWLSRVLDGLILLLVAWLLVAAAYVSLGRQFVPAIADYRAELLQWVEDKTGRAITLDSLRGEMQGSQPVLTLRGLRVHETSDPAGPTLLALDHVTARIDVWASLWQRRLVMDALQIEGLALELVQEAEGRWRLHGLGERLTGDFDLDATLSMLFEQRRITLLDTHILVSPHERPQWVFQKGEISLLNGAGWHRLDGQVDLPEGGVARWQVSALQNGKRWQDMSLGFFLDLPPIDWVQHVPPTWLELARLEALTAGGQFWGSWQEQRLQSLQGRLEAPLVRLDPTQSIPTIGDLRADFALQWGEKQQLRIQDLEFQLGDQAWPVSRFFASRDIAEDRWQLRADSLSLGLLMQMIPAHLLSEKAATTLATLAPQGTVRQILLEGEGTARDWRTIRWQALLDDVGVQAWQGAPAIQGISGSLIGSPSKGQLRVASDEWGMHLPKLFPQAWSYDRLTGQMDWQWSEAKGLRLSAPGFRVESEEGIGAAALQLELPMNGITPTMALRVSLHDTQARFTTRYLPTRAPVLSSKLAQWIDQARIEGLVPLAIFSYQGSLLRDALPAERKFSLYARLEDGGLTFQRGWPRLQAVDGTLRVDNLLVRIDQASAQLWDTVLTDVRVTIDRAQPTDPLELNVKGEVSGPLQDGLRLMQETPLADLTKNTLQGWMGDGRVEGQLAMLLNLVEGAAPLVDVAWRVDASTLSIPLLQTTLSDLAGQFSYTSTNGLQAEGLRGLFLGNPVAGSISSQDGRPEATFTGRHSIDALQDWPMISGLPEGLLSGELAWEARGVIATPTISLQIDSDLVGVAIDLPSPLAKTADESLPSRLTLTRRGESQNWRLNLGSDLQAVVQTGGPSMRGDVRYRSGNPVLSSEPGLSLAARFEQIELPLWQQWVKQNRTLLPDQMQGTEAADPIQRPSAKIANVRTLDLRVDEFIGFGQTLDDLAMSAIRDETGWLFDIDQPRMRGQVIVPNLKVQPVVFNMQRLSLAREDHAPRVDALASPLVPEDPLPGVNPFELPPVDVNIDTLYWGADPVGGLSFKMRPSQRGARITSLDVNLRGLHLTGDMDWNAAGPTSGFRGKLETDDISEVLRAWGYAPTLTSRSFATIADLVWSGSPVFFALGRSSGDLQINARNGTLQSGEGSADALRVFGLLNFNALTRRLRLDFSDLFGRGTAYDTLAGDLQLKEGVMRTRSPLIMDGPGAKMQLDGQLDLPAGSIDMGMLVTLPVTNNLPLAAIIAGAPYIGGVLFLADKILGDRVARFASVKYRISGDWQQPTIEFDRAFDNEAALEE